MHYLMASSINDLQVSICNLLIENGAESAPRGMRTLEVLGLSFDLDSPRSRLTTLKSRKWSPALAVAELAWHLRGDEEVAPLAFYTPRWREFADLDGVVRGSCYGARIFKPLGGGGSQWENVKRLLQEDPSSRRAVLSFRVSEDVSRHTKDVSCTNTLQFLVREGKLHAFVGMRSNDAIWGVPYDVFLFTSLQELMALELGVELGRYHHYAASMHIYERHFDLAKRVASERDIGLGNMPPMDDVSDLHALAREEEHLRLTGRFSGVVSSEFGRACMKMLGRHKAYSEAA